jgi:hypothetical protein
MSNDCGCCSPKPQTSKPAAKPATKATPKRLVELAAAGLEPQGTGGQSHRRFT